MQNYPLIRITDFHPVWWLFENPNFNNTLWNGNENPADFHKNYINFLEKVTDS